MVLNTIIKGKLQTLLSDFFSRRVGGFTQAIFLGEQRIMTHILEQVTSPIKIPIDLVLDRLHITTPFPSFKSVKEVRFPLSQKLYWSYISKSSELEN